MKAHLWTIGTTLVALTAAAHAQPNKKLKAEFLCGTFVDGKIKKPIAGGKVGKLTDTIACALHLADANEPGHAVHLRTTQNGKEISTIEGTVNTGDTTDFEAFLKPDEAFKPCQDFEITVGISDPGGQFSKTIKVQQGCPKPPQIKGELQCTSQYGDGTAIKFPKTKKLQGRLEASISCSLYATNIPDGVKLTGSIATKGHDPHTGAIVEMPPSDHRLDVTLEPGNDFDVCGTKFAILGTLVDADGAQRWSGKIDIPAQYCPD